MYTIRRHDSRGRSNVYSHQEVQGCYDRVAKSDGFDDYENGMIDDR